MRQELFDCTNDTDAFGMPAGGTVRGLGIDIRWQNGPLGLGAERREPNGAFVEGVLEAALQRLRYYQSTCGGRFACTENELAIGHLECALDALDQRTKRRKQAGTEGTHAEDDQA